MSCAQSIERLAKVGVTFFCCSSPSQLRRLRRWQHFVPTVHCYLQAAHYAAMLSADEEICGELCRKTSGITSHVGLHKRNQILHRRKDRSWINEVWTGTPSTIVAISSLKWRCLTSERRKARVCSLNRYRFHAAQLRRQCRVLIPLTRLLERADQRHRGLLSHSRQIRHRADRWRPDCCAVSLLSREVVAAVACLDDAPNTRHVAGQSQLLRPRDERRARQPGPGHPTGRRLVHRRLPRLVHQSNH